MLAPALLVTVLVVVFGFVATPDDEDDKRSSAPEPGVSATPSTAPTTTPTSTDATRPEGVGIQRKLVGPRVVFRAKPRPRYLTISPFTFTVASFNVLGHNHSLPGGHAARFADSGTRMGWTLSALADTGVDVVGLQELQPQQVGHLTGRGGSTWSVWPGHSLGREAGANSIAWRKAEFEMVKGDTITVPYFDGKPWPMPYVLLRHHATGQQIWVANFHNPANKDSPKQNTGYRRVAIGRETVLARSLEATGYPVFFTGDFNDRAEAFCPITTSTALKAANGGSTGTGCSPPDRMEVDWVFGSDRVGFAGYAAIEGGLVGRASDHPLVVAQATVPGYRERIVYPRRRR